MQCPVCNNVDLVMADRQGIEIDYCPKCRGVWLDRGELDKIIERTVSSFAPPETPTPGYRNRETEEHRGRRDREDEYYRKKKRRGLLGELFDFD